MKPHAIWLSVLLSFCLIATACKTNRTSLLANTPRDYEQQILIHTKAIEENPDDMMAYFKRGNARALSYQYEAALLDYDQAIRFGKEDAITYQSRGYMKTNLNRHEEAIQDYDRAIELKPTDHTIYHNRSVAKRLLGDVQGAIADLEKALEIEPNFVPAQINLNQLKGEIRKE